MGGVRQTSPWTNTPLGRHPPRQTRPQADIHPWANTPLGRHPLGKHTPIQTSPSDSYCSGLECIPTGMHSCSFFFFCFFVFCGSRRIQQFIAICAYIFLFISSQSVAFTLADPRGRQGCMPPPAYFFHFQTVFGPNNGFSSPQSVLAPSPSSKSWIRHWFMISSPFDQDPFALLCYELAWKIYLKPEMYRHLWSCHKHRKTLFCIFKFWTSAGGWTVGF